MTTTREAAFAALRAGLSVVPPAENGSKAPFGPWKKWQQERPTEAQLQTWYANGRTGLGIVCGAVSGGLEMLEFEGRAVDVGIHTEFLMDRCDRAGLGDVINRIVAGYSEWTPSGGIHLLYRCTEVSGNLKLARRPATAEEFDEDPTDPLRVLIETRGEGGYTIVAPTHGRVHDSGGAWTIQTGGFDSIATITPEERRALHEVARSFDQLPKGQEQERPKGGHRFTGPDGGDTPLNAFDRAHTCEEILTRNGFTHHHDDHAGAHYTRPGKSTTKGTSATVWRDNGTCTLFSSSIDAPIEFIGGDRNLRPSQLACALEYRGDFGAMVAELGRAARAAQASSRSGSPGSGRAADDQGDDEPGERLNDPLPDEPLTEYGYARRLIHVYGDQLRHVLAWKQWLVWDGKRWTNDTSGQAARWMKVIARQITTDALAIRDADTRRKAMNAAKRGESAAGVAGALTLASTEAEIAISHEDFDKDPFLLNCRNGTLDLRTGELRPPDPADLLTKITGAEYHPDATGTEFPRFLERIQPDTPMRNFLGRLLGHTLEGRQTVHVLPIFHGAGANGKGTITTAVLGALGDYADTADPELLTARTFDAHPTGVANLFGLRLAVLHEGDAGRHLAEGTMKRLTGGDRIKARRMREDFWSFDPSHTFVMLTNHKPLVAGTDEGTWRRLRLVPFNVVIPAEERDEELGDRLALEADAVLAWLVAGYQEWHTQGLNEPPEVMAATAAYRAESDLIGRFLAERCVLGPDCRVRSSQLFDAWSRWCTTEGVEAGSNKAFTTELQNKGLDTKRTNMGAVFHGVGLAAESD